jgi:hypothetical protein
MKNTVRREIALLFVLLFVGLVLMPLGIYLVGREVFGEYGGHGYGDYFGTLSGKIRSRDAVAWFLVLSPYLAWQFVRLTAFAWRLASSHPSKNSSSTPLL